jgi:broad specificity phosphatase PhoE
VTDRFVTLLRHGEVTGGARFRGPSDDPLSPRGRAQLEAAFDRTPNWTGLLASPSRRCREPAAALAERLGMPLTIDPGLAERGFGDWNGRRAADIPQSDLMDFYADPASFTPPGAEPLEAFARRVGRAWKHRLGDAKDETLLLTHGGVIRVIIAQVLGMPLASLTLIEVPYACRTRIRVPDEPGRPSLVSHRAE